MSFGLKNIGATCQRLVNRLFKAQIGCNMKVYIDDMLVKNFETSDHIRNLEETFDTLRRYQMKLNLIKYACVVIAKKFLEFLVSRWKIETDFEKIKAIINMKHSSSKKEIQQLNRRIIVLNRFISKSTERCLPFFKILRQAKDFSWLDKWWQSFEDLKKYLTSPSLLTKSKMEEILYLYLATSIEAVSSVLVQEDKNRIQRSIYYTSKVLHNAEI